MTNTMTGRDVYLRYDNGPVQHFRAWDAERFILSQIEQGLDAKEPYVVSAATEAEYREEHKR